MNFRAIAQLVSFRDVRNGVLGLSVVVGGLALAFFTIYAQQTGNGKLAGYAAGASLVFVILIVIFVIPPLARSASAEASQLNLPFEFTLGGAIFVGLIVVIGFAAWNTGNNFVFLVLSLMAGALVVGFFAGNFGLKKLDVKMRFPEAIRAGEPTPIAVSLHNRKRLLPTFSVVAEVRGKEREKSVLLDEIKQILPAKWAEKVTRPPIIKHTLDYFAHIPRRASAENIVEHIFPQRGRFIIKDFELSTRFPFGFFRHRRRLSAQKAEIVIFPRAAPIDVEAIDLPLEIGRYVTQRKGLGQDLLALRDYQPLDDLRRVDWKATARANRLIVREFAAEDERRVTIVFDSRLPPDADEKRPGLRERIEAEQKGASVAPISERFEKGVSQTAAILAHFIEEQCEARLIINDNAGEFGIGKTHLNENLKRLALIEPNFDEAARFSFESLEEMLSERENSYTFFVTTQPEDSLPEDLIYRAKVINF